MTDPRNIAHDKKVQQEKKHHHEAIAPDAEAKPQPGRKPALHHEKPSTDDAASLGAANDAADAGAAPSGTA